MVNPTENPVEETSNLNLAWYHLKSLQFIAQKGKWPNELGVNTRKSLKRNGIIKNHYISQKGFMPQLTPIGINLIKLLSQPTQTTLTNYTLNNSTVLHSITKEIQSKTVK